MFGEDFIVIEDKIFGLYCKLFVFLLLILYFGLSSVVYLLGLVLFIAYLKMDLFQQPLKYMAFMLQVNSFSFKGLDKEFIYFRRVFQMLIMF